MSEHVVSIRLYVTIFLTLMVLTALTVWVAFIDLGVMNTVVAMAVAATKATLVILYFMHVRYSSRLTWLVIGNAFFWLAIMMSFIVVDMVERGVIR